jgi:hypothetical protein
MNATTYPGPYFTPATDHLTAEQMARSAALQQAADAISRIDFAPDTGPDAWDLVRVAQFIVDGVDPMATAVETGNETDG